mgnify:CR=1 FL=1
MQCPKCDKEVGVSFSFCPSCGFSLSEVKPPQENSSQIVTNESVHKAESMPVEKWYFKTWVVVLTLLFLFPLGAFLMWKGSKFGKKTRIGVTIVLGLIFLSSVFGTKENQAPSSAKNDGKTPVQTAANSAKTDAQKAESQKSKEPVYDYSCNVEGIGKVKGLWASNVGTAIAEIKSYKTLETSFSVTRAQGIFKMVYIVVSNNQKDAVTLDSTAYKLIDDQGREYSHSTEAQTTLQMRGQETFFLKKVNPGLTAGGWVVFDIPEKANVVGMKFSGGFTGEKAEVPFKVMLEN